MFHAQKQFSVKRKERRYCWRWRDWLHGAVDGVVLEQLQRLGVHLSASALLRRVVVQSAPGLAALKSSTHNMNDTYWRRQVEVLDLPADVTRLAHSLNHSLKHSPTHPWIPCRSSSWAARCRWRWSRSERRTCVPWTRPRDTPRRRPPRPPASPSPPESRCSLWSCPILSDWRPPATVVVVHYQSNKY